MSSIYHHLRHCGVQFTERNNTTIISNKEVAKIVVENLIELCGDECDNDSEAMLMHLIEEAKLNIEQIKAKKIVEALAKEGVTQMSLFDVTPHPV